jgi:hypothetical protein
MLPRMGRLSVFDRKPPLSLLMAAHLFDLAEEFRATALTAATPAAQRSLDALAVRYLVLAANREIEERGATRH